MNKGPLTTDRGGDIADRRFQDGLCVAALFMMLQPGDDGDLHAAEVVA